MKVPGVAPEEVGQGRCRNPQAGLSAGSRLVTELRQLPQVCTEGRAHPSGVSNPKYQMSQRVPGHHAPQAVPSLDSHGGRARLWSRLGCRLLDPAVALSTGTDDP